MICDDVTYHCVIESYKRENTSYRNYHYYGRSVFLDSQELVMVIHRAISSEVETPNG